MAVEQKDIESDTELHHVLWTCLTCLSDSKWRFIPTNGENAVEELAWARDSVVHILEFLEKRYNLKKGDAERFAQMSWDKFEQAEHGR